MSGWVSRCLGVGLAAALAGCAAAPPRLPLPPEPVTVEPRQGAAIPVARGYSEVLVRAFVEDEAGRRREVGGADCLLEAGDTVARFTTPGRVLVPVPRAGAPVLGVACRAGEREGIARRALTRAWADPYPYPYPYSFGPHRFGRPYGWWGDPFPRHRSGVWLGAEIGDPLWGHAPWPRGAVAVGYPDVEVTLR